jgi:transposase
MGRHQVVPSEPRGIPRVDDRRVLNGIFRVLRSGAPCCDLPASYGPRTTCYNRFVRWLQAGVWDRIMDALAAGHDPTVQMIDTSIVRVHRHGACIADNNQQDMGRSRGGLTSKIHAIVDANGLPMHLALTPGEAHDNRLCSVLFSAMLPQTIVDMTRTGSGHLLASKEHGGHPTKTKSPAPVSRTKLDRTVLQQDQAMSACCDPIRPTRGQLPSLHQTRIKPRLAAR